MIFQFNMEVPVLLFLTAFHLILQLFHLSLTSVFTLPSLSLLAYITLVIRPTPHFMMSISAESSRPNTIFLSINMAQNPD